MIIQIKTLTKSDIKKKIIEKINNIIKIHKFF